ncbi:hypothetical protein, partial [Shigella flexneri]|uniref:hypothetical protein n=1 Tax=Shigella flexneri TaxID=623 RepID=UPI00112F4B61
VQLALSEHKTLSVSWSHYQINDRFPRIIIKKYRTLQGKVVWLWILPFVIEWLIVCTLGVNS